MKFSIWSVGLVSAEIQKKLRSTTAEALFPGCARMKIIKIELENFRQYQGVNTVDISTDPDRNFTILQGQNGNGKSNFMNAVVWCLYGDEMFSSKNGKRDVINETVKNTLENGESASVSVTVTMGDEKPEYKFTRKISYYNENGKTIGSGVNFTGYKISSVSGWEKISSPDWEIDRHFIPHDLLSIFFFDGEKISDYFEGTNKVKQNVEKLAQIDILDDAISTLEGCSRSFNKDISNAMPEQTANNDEEEAIRSEIETLEKEKEQIDSELAGLNKERKEIDDYLKNNSDAVVQELQKEREAYEEQQDDVLKNLKRTEQLKKELLSDKAPVVFSLEALDYSLKVIEENTKKGVLPPKIKDVFLDELLKKGVCICGRKLSDDDDSRKHIQELYHEIASSKMTEDAISGKYAIESMLKDYDFSSDFADLLDDEDRLKSDLEGIKDNLSEISSKLSKYNVEEINRKESRRKDLDKTINQKNVSKGAKGNSIVKLNARLSEIEEIIKDCTQKEQKTRNIQKKKEFADHLCSLMKEIREEIVDEVRQQLEEKTKEYFFSLIWKKEDSFKDVIIEDDGRQYRISVLSKYGNECLGDLSAGEKQVLALSFTAALYSVSGYSVPVIIDTPLGRISGKTRDNIASSLPKYLPQTQVIMLVTDTEYSPEVRDKLKPYVGYEYLIKYDPSTLTSKVVPYEQ
jgi:DNA sulfur modification protein DndD